MPGNEEPVVIAVTEPKLQPFWTSNLEVWFLQAEAQFWDRNITQQETKFDKVLLTLDEATVARVLNLIRNPPAHPYDALKDKLLDKYDRSDYERVLTIRKMSAIDDERPSHLMDRMTAILGSRHEPDNCLLFRAQFIHKLPEEIRATLVREKFETCGDLTCKADEIWLRRRASGNPPASIYAATNEAETATVSEKRKPSFAKHARKFRHHPGGPYVYHSYYNDKATRCEPPCSKAENWHGRPSIASIAAGSLTFHDSHL